MRYYHEGETISDDEWHTETIQNDKNKLWVHEGAAITFMVPLVKEQSGNDYMRVMIDAMTEFLCKYAPAAETIRISVHNKEDK